MSLIASSAGSTVICNLSGSSGMDKRSSLVGVSHGSDAMDVPLGTGIPETLGHSSNFCRRNRGVVWQSPSRGGCDG